MNNCNRRLFLKTLSAAVSSIPMTELFAAQRRPSNPPNVIYILADDLGYGDLGCYGQKDIQTPNIDQMAREGMTFTQHYAGSSVCAPSRCALLTGMHTGHCFIRDNYDLTKKAHDGYRGEGNIPIPNSHVTIPEIMKKAGYATAAIGKWGLGYPGSEGDPLNQGFDHFFGYNCQRQAHHYYPKHLWRDRRKEQLDGKKYSHDLFADEALAFIRENKDKPFFLYLPFTIPHTEFSVPELGAYADKDWEKNHKIQAAMITRMDRDVGRVLDLLKQLGLDDKTLVIFTSDNGPHGGAKTDQRFRAAGPLRDKKGSFYEGGIRVPMIARWPGHIQPGSTTNHISAFWDVMPTLAELNGQPVPEKCDGLSMLPTLLGQNNQKQHDYLYWERGGAQAVRQGKWKAIKEKKTKNIELYDLENDIGERLDLAKKHPDVVRQMKQIMAEARTPSDIFQNQ